MRYTAPHTFSDDPPSPAGVKGRTGRAKAEAWLRSVRSEIERGAWISPAQAAETAQNEEKRAAAERFGLYAATWIAQRKSNKGVPLRPKTRAEYERQLAAGLSTFADDRLNAITPARVRAWHDERTKRGATQAGAEARLLRAILNTALVDGIILTNPVPPNLTRTSTGKAHRPPTADELSVLLEEVGPFYRLGVLLGAYGGLRLSEWRALRRKDVRVSSGRTLVSVERQALFIPKTGWVVGAPKSDEGVRVVPLPLGLTPDVEAHLAKFAGPFPDDLLFPPTSSSEFMHDRQFNKHWNRARDVAGVRHVVREHDLRAFAGTALAQSGATLRETMAFLGHSTTAAAMAYQATTGREAELVDRMPLPAAPRKVARLHE